MSKCKSCGKDIMWIQMHGGKMMPCDPKPISYKFNIHEGKLRLITGDGKVVRGDFDPTSDKIGYTSHFATCPNANQHRKKDDDGEQTSMW